MPFCPECHHYPSERFEECRPERCYCKCHDVADAAPDLFAACKAAEEFLRLIGQPAPPAPWRQLVAAINKAEQGADHA